MTTFALLLALCVAGRPAPPRTELLIRAVDEAGRPVTLARADVYLDIWGGGDLFHLPRSGNTARVRLDRQWTCEVAKEYCDGAWSFAGRIILEADGYATVTSDLFEWMAASAPGDSPEPVTIRFPRAAPVRIAFGQSRDVTITFRTRQSRTVRVVDPSGRPMAGVLVTAVNFFAATNHMGASEGEDLVTEAPTDHDGEAAIPDADIEYGLSFSKRHWVLVKPLSPDDPVGLIRRLNSQSLTVAMRPHARVPLLLKFERDGAPVSGRAVSACVAPCAGACCGELAKTDADGSLTVRDFYPEEYERVFVPTKDSDYKSIWEIDPRKIATPRQRLSVTLPR